MTFSMSVMDKTAKLALEAEDEENALSSKVLIYSVVTFQNFLFSTKNILTVTL